MHRNMQPAYTVRGTGPGTFSQAAPHPPPPELEDPPPLRRKRPTHAPAYKGPAFSYGSGRAGLRMGGEAKAC